VAIVHRDTRITFAEFDARINRLANALLGLGLEENARVAALIENSPLAVEVRFALMKAGLCMVPLNTRQAAAEQAEVVAHSESTCLIVSETFTERGRELMARCPGVKWVIAGGGLPGALEYEALLAGSGDQAPETFVSIHALERIAYTSGTTGTPKGVMRSFLNFIARLRNDFLNEDHVIDERDVFLNVAPLTHAARNHVHKYYVKGAVNIVMDRFDPEAVLATIERERVTGVMLVPTMLVRLLRFERLAEFNASTLRIISVGTAPISPETLAEAFDRFGPIVRQTYGLTEASQPILLMPPTALVDADPATRRARLGAAGRPALGVEVRLVDATGGEVPRGDVGEIVIRGDVVTPGYWNDPEATADVLRDGWLHTGDLAWQDGDGFIHISGRAKDVIISGGFNVYAREVERALETHPGVREAAVVGVPDAEWGETIVAFVVLERPGTIESEELIRQCQARLGSYKKPRVVHEVSELPRNVQGKVVKRELREEAVRRSGRIV
jgi:long-chain acyl-CoA synthetase